MKYVDISRFDRDAKGLKVIGRVSLLDDGAVVIEGDAVRAALKNGARNLADLSSPILREQAGEAFLEAVASQFTDPMTFKAGEIRETASVPPPIG